MDVYILDNQFRRIKLIDEYESLIWTERWNEVGDFTLDLRYTLSNRSWFQPGLNLAMNNSYRMMVVENVDMRKDDEGRTLMQVSGRSFESWLEQRAIKMNWGTGMFAIWPGTPGTVARNMFDYIVRNENLSVGDGFPYLQPGSIFPASTIPEHSGWIRWEQRPDTLLSAIQQLCQLYDMGYRLVRNFDTSELYFDIYTGDDRTTRQSVFPAVTFSSVLGNIQNTSNLKSIRDFKNLAYVFSDQGTAAVHRSEDTLSELVGYNRRVKVVTPSIDPDSTDIQGDINDAGDQGLRESLPVDIFDGEVVPDSGYVYGVDYNLGDLVEMRTVDGLAAYKRVTEQIFVQDDQGERSYPTLAHGEYETFDTWVDEPIDVWEDKTTEVWEDY